MAKQTKTVPVIDTDGVEIGYVSKNATSVDAAKLAGAYRAYLRRRDDGVYCWYCVQG